MTAAHLFTDSEIEQDAKLESIIPSDDEVLANIKLIKGRYIKLSTLNSGADVSGSLCDCSTATAGVGCVQCAP